MYMDTVRALGSPKQTALSSLSLMYTSFALSDRQRPWALEKVIRDTCVSCSRCTTSSKTVQAVLIWIKP